MKKLQIVFRDGKFKNFDNVNSIGVNGPLFSAETIVEAGDVIKIEKPMVFHYPIDTIEHIIEEEI